MRYNSVRVLSCFIILFLILISSFEIVAIENLPKTVIASGNKNGDEQSAPLMSSTPSTPFTPSTPSTNDLPIVPLQNMGLGNWHPLNPEEYELSFCIGENMELDLENNYYPCWKIEPSLLASMKDTERVKVLITSNDMGEVRELLGIENPNYEYEQKGNMMRLKTSILEIESHQLPKIAQLDSVVSVQHYELPKPPQFPVDLEDGTDPAMWNAVKYHGADEAWSLGYNGSGVKVAVIDTGVDFANPDLNGTQARDGNPSSPYFGWPLAFDSRSMNSYLSSGGQGYPGSNNWFSDTNTTDMDSNGNGTLDSSGYNVIGIVSQSGIYHIGEHPDTRLKNLYGYNAVLVVDENTSGVYDTVYVDIDNDKNFTDEKPCRKGDEVSTHDFTGDGVPDRSGGMTYFIADGVNPVPYSDIIAAENGYSLPIPPNGSLVAFMINDFTEAGRNHGTLCASAVAGQGVIGGGRVKGTAPNAKIIAVGNVYQQGTNWVDSYYFSVEGYDGIPGTGDEANIVSCSFGSSDVIRGGWEFTSRLVDNITTYYAPNVTFAVASGNGGYGYGTVVSPGSSVGVVTCGAALNKQITDIVYWSNRGPNAVGQVDPDIVSVGVSAYGDRPLNQGTANGNNAYSPWSGTSLSTPVTAGILALIYDAYNQSNGQYPSSDLTRKILMSTADNLNYDPLVQGAGFSNATRATKVANNISGMLLSPTFWTAGDYRGTDYDAFAHIMHPGDTDDTTITVSNAHQNDTMEVFISDYILTMTESHSVTIEANKSREDASTARPDFLVPLRDSKNNISYIPNDTALLKVSGFMPWDEFDPDFDYTQENRFWTTIYNWNDNNGNGSYWNDTNGDGVAQQAEIEWGELSSVCSSSITATTQEARMHDPISRIDDGLVVGVFHSPTGDAPEISHIYIQSQCYNRTDWSWLSANTSYLSVEAKGQATFEASLMVPPSTPIGIYEGLIAINDTRNETVVPVIVNVAGNSEQFTFGGNTLSTDLYANDQIFGAFRWGWRYEGGDWRFYFTDIPDSFNVKPGTKLIADVKWSNYPTDIDVFLLGGSRDSFSNEMPSRFGPYTLDIKGASSDQYIWGGKFRFNTTTNGPHEIISADLSPGLNEIILHNVLYAGQSFSENVTGTIGTVNVTPYPWDVGLIENVANLTGTQQFELLSSFNLSGIDVQGYGVYPPMEYPNELVYQNVPSDKTTSNWSREFDVSGAKSIKVNISSPNSIDIDLYLLRDDGDGIPEWGSEQVASSTSPYADEEVILNSPSDGKYWVFVHGWNVPLSPSLFDCYIEVVSGNNINISDIPGGSISAGEPVYFNATHDLPPITGEYRGVIYVMLTNLSDSISIPFMAELEQEKPIITNPQPANGLWVNSTQPMIGAQYYDSGSGINTSRVFIFLDGMNHTDNATITSSAINLIPPSAISEGNHTVYLIVTDMFGNQNSTTWRFFVDSIDPIADAGFDESVIEDEVIVFDGSLSSDENEIINLTWDFADGNFGYGMNPSHSYPQSGTYVVTLTVWDIANNTDSDTVTVYVNNLAPHAVAGEDQIIDEGDFAFFDGSDSYDTPSDNSTLIFTWYFGDGDVVSGITTSHVFIDNGVYTVTLVVEDDNGFTDSDTLSVTVNNVAPTADAHGPYEGDEGSEITFTGTASDPGISDTLTYHWDFGDGNTSTLQNPTHTYADDGIFNVILTVTDDDGGLDSDSAIMTVYNVAPQVEAGGPYSGDEGMGLTFFGSATDPGSDILTYEWDLDDDGIYDDAAGQNPSWTWYDEGVYIIGLRVSDDDGGIGTDTASININNVAPIADAGDSYIGNEGDTITFTGTANDPGSDLLTYEWDFDDSDGVTYSDFTGSNPTWIWPDDFSGLIYLRVTDDDGGIGTDTASVTINNVAPIADTGGSYTGNEGSALTITGSAEDPGTDILIIEWDLDDDGFYDDAMGENPTWTWYDDGVYFIHLKVTDDDGGVGTNSATVIINNVAPTPDAGGPYVGNEGTSMDFIGNQTDPGSDTFTYLWDFGDGKISTQQNPTHIYSDDGVYTVSLTVTDDDGGMALDYAITIVYNVPPSIEPVESPMNAIEDETFSLRILATDSEGDMISFADDTELFNIDPLSGLIEFVPSNDDVGYNEVTITVRDDEGGTSTLVFVINVLNANDPPALHEVGPQNAQEDEHFQFTVFANDIDSDDELKFSDDTDLFEIDSNTGIISFTPTNDQVGVEIVTITVRDAEGASDSERVTFTILNTNDAPVLDSISDRQAVVGQRITFTAIGNDIDDIMLTYSDDSELFEINPVTGEVTFTPNQEDVGMHFINITVFDDSGASDTQMMKLEIESIPEEEPEQEIDWISLILLILMIILILLLLIHILMHRKSEEDEKPLDLADDEKEPTGIEEKEIEEGIDSEEQKENQVANEELMEEGIKERKDPEEQEEN
ncbi:MAG: PKD domain-containing protein [Thermoplasmata archaeon]|nr:MAG: PKD domain-containing protein [Thermoplasmata archaeon]